MSLSSLPTPMIPVYDDRLICPADGDQTHRVKIDSYNDLLESIYIRELELGKLKAGLVDMRHEIVEEAQTLDTNGTPIIVGPATELNSNVDESSTDSTDANASDSDVAALSESGASDSSSKGLALKLASGNPKKRRGSKGKYKGKGRERARISGEEMSANWDYNVNPSRHVRRVSNPFTSDVEDD